MRAAITPFLSILTVLPLLGCDPMVDVEQHVTARDGTCGEAIVPLVIERNGRVGEVRAWRAGDQVCVQLDAPHPAQRFGTQQQVLIRHRDLAT